MINLAGLGLAKILRSVNDGEVHELSVSKVGVNLQRIHPGGEGSRVFGMRSLNE
jgi:hypothetical protein